ncbi:MAG: carbohydrate binding domain-containing protein [Halioglobus sp.]|nr:carbohydrate binding domain-containing protein [Halioglobus sp.]
MLKQTVALLVIVSLILLGSYWLKNFLGLNIFNHFSLSNYPVFSAFDSRVIDHQPFPGVVVSDSFDETGLLAAVSNWWQFHNATVEMAPDPDNPSNTTMMIRPSTAESWRGNFTRFVQVNPGEQYQYSIRARISGTDSSARVGLIVYNADQQALSWKAYTETVVAQDTWLDIRHNFTVPPDIKYIKFRITGADTGDYAFDDFVLTKLSTSPPH